MTLPTIRSNQIPHSPLATVRPYYGPIVRYWSFSPDKPAIRIARIVKNLSWLIKNSHYVSVLSIQRADANAIAAGYECVLVADGMRGPYLFTYRCNFRSREVAEHFIKRPSLTHCQVVI